MSSSVRVAFVHAREVLDSRGNPTVEAEVTLDDGSLGRAIVPSGASKGQREALELRDGDKKRFGGKGVMRAVANVQERLAPAVVNERFEGITAFDRKLLSLDATPQKSELGANAILALSMAFAQALARSRRIPLYEIFRDEMGRLSSEQRLPVPLMNVLNGGEHADNGLAFQEFMIVPHGFSTFREALRAGCEVFHALKTKLHDRKLSTAVGDEGGFAPALSANDEALRLVAQSVEAAGYKLGSQVSLALDVASSSFYNEKAEKYDGVPRGGQSVSRDELIAFYGELAKEHPLVSIEDGLQENDWEGWTKLTTTLGKKLQLVGDDLFVTQARYVEKGIREHSANAVLVKVNQVGSLLETFETMSLCRRAGWNAVVSHRSGESEDTTIAHLAVGSGAGQIKTGSLSRSERTAKYNELLRIEDEAERAGKPIAFAGDLFQK